MKMCARQLNMRQRTINLCYEEWAIALLKFSRKDDEEIKCEIIDKMDVLRTEILAKKESLGSIDYTRIAKIAKDRGK